MSNRRHVQLDLTTPPASPGVSERNKLMESDMEFARRLQMEQEESLSNDLIANLGAHQFNSPNQHTIASFNRLGPGRRLGSNFQDDTNTTTTNSNTNSRPKPRSQDLENNNRRVSFNEVEPIDNFGGFRSAHNHNSSYNHSFDDAQDDFHESFLMQSSPRSYEYTPGITPEASIPEERFDPKEYVSQMDSPPTSRTNGFGRPNRSNSNPTTFTSNSNSNPTSTSDSNSNSTRSESGPSTLFLCPYPNCNEKYSFSDMYNWPNHVMRSHTRTTASTLSCPLCDLSQEPFFGELVQHIDSAHSQYLSAIPNNHYHRAVTNTFNHHDNPVPVRNNNTTTRPIGGYFATNDRRINENVRRLVRRREYEEEGSSEDEELYGGYGNGRGGRFQSFGGEEIDIDSMDYEQLHELAEKIGKVEKKIEVERFPMREFGEKDKKALQKGGGKDNETSKNCLICFEDYEVGDMIRYLPCMHGYHRVCIDRWIVDEKKINCPVCKYDLSQNQQ
eukprot:TRINITY_DN1351_c0_g1_i1.p1 TRINITY_DN1351_c0_g1~~TRINITY_DN1351_c0_g1_i1.p1  ORF type:complete len:501 (-),score=111.86 TRINITY_DN1351_c0_g1_i1:35-1537(-)